MTHPTDDATGLAACPWQHEGETHTVSVYGDERPLTSFKLAKVACSCGVSSPHFATRSDAVRFWNSRRPTPPAPAGDDFVNELREQLRDACAAVQEAGYYPDDFGDGPNLAECIRKLHRDRQPSEPAGEGDAETLARRANAETERANGADREAAEMLRQRDVTEEQLRLAVRERDEARERVRELEAQLENAFEVYDEARATIAGIERLLRAEYLIEYEADVWHYYQPQADGACVGPFETMAAAVRAALEELEKETK